MGPEKYLDSVDSCKNQIEKLKLQIDYKKASDKNSSTITSHRANSSIITSGNSTERKITLKKLTMGNLIDNKPLNYDYNTYGKKIDSLNRPYFFNKRSQSTTNVDEIGGKTNLFNDNLFLRHAEQNLI